jgi:shikimate dehydrogenase
VSSPALQEITACIGHPVAGNPTQYVMEKAYASAGLDWRYLTLEVTPDKLADAVRGMRALGFRGFNCTKPHKCSVVPLLDEVREAAGLIGAVNCVVREGEKLVGENTDGKGFVESLRPLINPAGKRVVILGAGGAARAIAVELGLAKAGHLTIVNRSAERGTELAALVADKLAVPSEFTAWRGEYAVPANTDVLINATSIGLFDPSARVPVDVNTLRAGLIVADVVFSPVETRFLKEARRAGSTTLDGLGMLVNQARLNFQIWTGVEPDAELLRDALDEFLSI